MLKKTISFLLAFVLLFSLLSMTGCSKKTSSYTTGGKGNGNSYFDNPLYKDKNLPMDTIFFNNCSHNFMEMCLAVYQETGCNPIVYAQDGYRDDVINRTSKSYKYVTVNYYAVGFGKYTIITLEEYADIQEYQNKTGRQVIYPTVKYSDRPEMDKNKYDANIYYVTENPKSSTLKPKFSLSGKFIPNYWKYNADEGKPDPAAEYNSLRIEGESGFTEEGIRYLYAYGRRVDGGVEVRLFMYEYYLYLLETSPETTPSADEYFKRIITGN